MINRFFGSVGKHDSDTKVEVLTTSASGTHGQQEVLLLQPISRSEVEMALKQTKVWNAAGLDGVMMMVYQDPARRLLSSRKHSSLIQLSTIE